MVKIFVHIKYKHPIVVSRTKIANKFLNILVLIWMICFIRDYGG
jgi:hypothetical protein